MTEPIKAPKKPPRRTGSLSKSDCQNGRPSLYFIFITLAIRTARATVAKNIRAAARGEALDFFAVTRPPIIAEKVIDIVEMSDMSLFGSGFFEIIIKHTYNLLLKLI